MSIRQSIRIIFRNKIYSIINISGLTIGITSAALIFLWVEHMVNYNREIPGSENIYMIGQHQYFGDEIYTMFVAPGPLSETLKNEFPEIKRNTRLREDNISFNPEGTQNIFIEKGYFADSTFFRMISIEFIRGNAQTVFNAASPIVISENMAEKMFGKEDPVGRILKTDDRDYEVTGVYKNNPKNTSFQFEWLSPISIMERYYEETGIVSTTNWRSNWLYCYVEVQPNADIDVINKKLARLIPDRIPGDKTTFFIYPVNKQRLYGEFKDGMATGSGYIRTVRQFFMIGLVILLIACINFMNLSTARSQKRALEVGVRKTFGAKRRKLIQMFLKESGLITCISLLISVGMIYLVLPYFNKLVSRELFIDWTNLYIWGGIIGIGLLCTFLAGSYPAFYLSSFSPLSTIKKQKAGNTGNVIWIRQGLVIFQFAVTYILICFTFAIFKQIQFGQERDLGLNKENLVTFPVTNEIRASHESVKNELINLGFVENAAFSSQSLLSMEYNSGGYNWQGKDPNTNPLVYYNYSTPGLVETAGMKMIDGTDFSSHHLDGDFVIINQGFAEIMGEEGRIGGKIGYSGNSDESVEIIGIVKDFVFNRIYNEKPEPVLFMCYADEANYLFVRLKPGANHIEATAKIKTVLQSFSHNEVFEPVFMDDRFERLFSNQRQYGRLAALFAGLAILISCLGLFGLSAFSAEQRRKEIGIRKVMGASIPDILILLGKNYMVLIMISFVIGVPVAWYIINWYLLQGYAYRISLGWTLFAEVAVLVTLIAMLAVSFQSLRAAMSNPVKAIKTE